MSGANPTSKRRLEDATDEAVYTHAPCIVCDLVPCGGISFSSIAEHRIHLNTVHHHRCIECQRLFPSEDLLEIHIDENHNPLLMVKQDRGEKIFRCLSFRSGCTKMCATPKNRRLHMIDKHQYPRDFKFDVINRGMCWLRES